MSNELILHASIVWQQTYISISQKTMYASFELHIGTFKTTNRHNMLTVCLSACHLDLVALDQTELWDDCIINIIDYD